MVRHWLLRLSICRQGIVRLVLGCTSFWNHAHGMGRCTPADGGESKRAWLLSCALVVGVWCEGLGGAGEQFLLLGEQAGEIGEVRPVDRGNRGGRKEEKQVKGMDVGYRSWVGRMEGDMKECVGKCNELGGGDMRRESVIQEETGPYTKLCLNRQFAHAALNMIAKAG